MTNGLVITMHLLCAAYHHCFLCNLFFVSARLGTGVVVLVAGLGRLVVLPFV